jgi:hypothetical protein
MLGQNTSVFDSTRKEEERKKSEIEMFGRRRKKNEFR